LNNLKICAILLSLSLLLAACGSTPAATTAAELSNANDQDDPGGQPEPDNDLTWLIGQSREDGQGSVTVTVTGKDNDTGADTIEFDVVMDTHSVDLNMDLALLATLTTNTGLSVNGLLWDGPLGGHHVEGSLSFPASVNGASLLEGTSMLTLTIQDVDAPERIFSWQR